MYADTSTEALQNAYSAACYETWAAYILGQQELHKAAYERAEAIRAELEARGAF